MYQMFVLLFARYTLLGIWKSGEQVVTGNASDLHLMDTRFESCVWTT